MMRACNITTVSHLIRLYTKPSNIIAGCRIQTENAKVETRVLGKVMWVEMGYPFFEKGAPTKKTEVVTSHIHENWRCDARANNISKPQARIVSNPIAHLKPARARDGQAIEARFRATRKIAIMAVPMSTRGKLTADHKTF